MLNANVKAAAVTHLTDARYFAAWEVEWLGFNLSPQDGVSAHELHAFREWIIGPRVVGEFDAGLPARIQAGSLKMETIKELKLDAVQVDRIFGPENIEEFLSPLGVDVFVEITVEGYASFEDLQEILTTYKQQANHFVLNFVKGGITWQDLQTGAPFSLDELASLTAGYSIYLEIEGALPTSIQSKMPELKGFSVRGGSEEKVGFKDFDELDEFFEDLEVE